MQQGRHSDASSQGDETPSAYVSPSSDQDVPRQNVDTSSDVVLDSHFAEALSQQFESLRSWLSTAFAAKLEEVHKELIAKHRSALAAVPSETVSTGGKEGDSVTSRSATKSHCGDRHEARNWRDQEAEGCQSAPMMDVTSQDFSEQTSAAPPARNDGRPNILLPVPSRCTGSSPGSSMCSEDADQVGPLPRDSACLTPYNHNAPNCAPLVGSPHARSRQPSLNHCTGVAAPDLKSNGLATTPLPKPSPSVDNLLSVMTNLPSAGQALRRESWSFHSHPSRSAGSQRSVIPLSQMNRRESAASTRGSAYYGIEHGDFAHHGFDSRRTSQVSAFGQGPQMLGFQPFYTNATTATTFTAPSLLTTQTSFKVDQVWESMAKESTRGSDFTGANSEGGPSSRRTSVLSKLSLHEPQWHGLQKATERQQTLGPGAKVMRDSEWILIRKLMVSPFAKKRATWDVIGMVLICYDIIVLPLQVFSLPDNPVFAFAKWFALLFWSLDIVATFFTGVFNPKGNYVDMRPFAVASKYVQSWLIFDLLVVAPDWLIVLTAGDSEGSATRLGKSVRALRMLRTLRLLRLAKLRRIVLKLEKRLNNEYMVAYINLAKLMLCIAVLNHVVACGWYGMSELGEDDDGWAYRLEFNDHPLHYRYLSSLHWSLSNFQGNMEVYPGTTAERIYACIVLYIGLMQVSYFISSITHFMTQIQQIHAETMQRRWKLLRYLYDNNITAELSVRVKQFVDKVTLTQRTKDKEVELLNVLSVQLQQDLQTEIKAPALLIHPLLNNLVYDDEALGGQLSVRITQVSMHYGECLYRKDEPCEQMFLIKSGRLRYSKNLHNWQDPRPRLSRHITGFQQGLFSGLVNRSKNSKGSTNTSGRTGEIYVDGGDWMSEMSLWTQWMHQGFCVAVSGSDVFGLVDSDLQEIVFRLSHRKKAKVAKYALSYVKWMNSEDASTLDDVTKRKYSRSDKVEDVLFNDSYIDSSQECPSVSECRPSPSSDTSFSSAGTFANGVVRQSKEAARTVRNVAFRVRISMGRWVSKSTSNASSTPNGSSRVVPSINLFTDVSQEQAKQDE